MSIKGDLTFCGAIKVTEKKAEEKRKEKPTKRKNAEEWHAIAAAERCHYVKDDGKEA